MEERRFTIAIGVTARIKFTNGWKRFKGGRKSAADMRSGRSFTVRLLRLRSRSISACGTN